MLIKNYFEIIYIYKKAGSYPPILGSYFSMNIGIVYNERKTTPPK